MTKKTTKLSPKRLSNAKLRGYIVIALGLVVLLAGSVYAYHGVASTLKTYHQNQLVAERKTRILSIYASLKLGSDYTPTTSSVFGDKRVYEWDKSRTYSSSETFTHNANVDVTVAQLRTKIEAAGFNYFEEPYPGSAFTELHFKSAASQYIRLNVSGKPRNDALAKQRGQATLNFDGVPDANQGPSDVVIKVNLDDNNE